MSKPIYYKYVRTRDQEAWAFREAQKAVSQEGKFEPYELIAQHPNPKRSITQNSLSHMWYRDAEEQGDKTAAEHRAYCKACIGLEILFAEKPKLREKYQQTLGGLTYEQKLACMIEPFDLPVTRMMSKKGMTKYLDAVYQHFTGLGYRLTVPNGEYDWSQYPEAA